MPIGRFSLWAMTLLRYIVAVLGDIGRAYHAVCQAMAYIYRIRRIAIRLFYRKLSYVGTGEVSTPRILDTESCKLPASTVGVDSFNFFPKPF